jgi:hypothetical protein
MRLLKVELVIIIFDDIPDIAAPLPPDNALFRLNVDPITYCHSFIVNHTHHNVIG